MNKSFRPFARDLAIITAVAALLLSKWAGAAQSPNGQSELQPGEQRIEVCTRRPMLQGKVNETVLVCETITVRKGG